MPLPGLLLAAGLFGREKRETAIPQWVGTPIGGMTAGGGLAAAFDGAGSQTATTGAWTGTGASASIMWIGKTFSPKKVFKKLTVESLTVGYQNQANPTITLRVRGKNGAAPTSATDGTIISDTLSFTDTTSVLTHTLNSTDLITAWDHIFLEVAVSANRNAGVSEVTMWEWA